MNQIQLTVMISYILMTCYFLNNWMRFSFRNPTCSPEDKFLSFVMFLIATIFWPLIVPMSLVEVIRQKKLDFNTIIPVIITVFAVSISYLILEFSAY
ncbi:hypothetical protein [Nostoc sp. TCL26-01]|uniref:hypothetical protein n=1 Tax=Nostoc sp. TCL26-01 TaxID=2576904 RepID=UPI0015BDDFE3|nr:hypothetical protein [Nostoc sp. TCL26-01]QLE55841.1 hypothetical protein FD725_10095 [Nostoc sp. TCL26-01]